MNAQFLFENVLRVSASAAVLIVVTAVVQLLVGKRLSASWRFALWMPVLIRLLAPALPESAFSLYNLPRILRPPVQVEIVTREPLPTSPEMSPRVLPPSDSPEILLEREAFANPAAGPVAPAKGSIDFLAVTSALWLLAGTIQLRSDFSLGFPDSGLERSN